jgi:SAM-dependent methyltransferase
MQDQRRTIEPDWYRVSFDSLYPIIYAHRTVEAAREDALFSIQETGIERSDVVLDLCCGNGRHMAHLLEKTDHVVGLDYSPHLLKLARRSLSDRGFLVRADMRCQPFEGIFDVVVNYFTSFGYFPSEEENLMAVRGLACALKPKGRFFIDYFNRAYTEKNLEPSTVRNHEEYEIHENRWIDRESDRINKTTAVFKDGHEISRSGESVRLYSDTDFEALLAKGGLRVEKIFGDYTGADCCDPTQPRMIVVGHKA